MSLLVTQMPDPIAWLDSRIKSLSMDYSLSLAERLVRYYKAEGNPVGFKGYEWQIGILNDLHPRQVITKRSQVGLTLLMLMKTMALLEQYSVVPYYDIADDGEAISSWLTCLYTFESSTKVSDFSADRLKAFIGDNPFLADLIREGDVDQARLKKVGNSSLYLGGRRNVSAVTSIPGNVVMSDEYDRTEDWDVGEQLESRLKASKMFRAKSQRGMYIKYSTPEAYGIGVSAEYEESDQHVFQVRCTRCNRWQEMIFPDSIHGYYEKGGQPQGDLYYQCLHCYRPLDWSEIGCWNRSNPLQTRNCEWVPRRLDYYEQVTKYGEGTRGYKVPWAYSAPVEEVMRDRDNKSKNYFFHHVLGTAFEEDSTGLLVENFTARLNPTFPFGQKIPNTVHVMGVDQGCYVTIWAMEPLTRGEGFQYGKWVEVYHEYIINEYAFTSHEATSEGAIVKFGRLNEIMKEWSIDLSVIDAEPNMASAHGFSREFLGQVYVNHSTKMQNHDPETGFNFVSYDEDADGNEVFVGKLSEDKTTAIDAYFSFVREGGLTFAAGDEETRWQKYIKHHTSIRKVLEQKQGVIGGLQRPVAVYRSFGPDHWGMAGKFAFQAAVLYHKAERPVTHIIIPNGFSGWKYREDLKK